MGNPVLFIDPDGRKVIPINRGGSFSIISQVINSLPQTAKVYNSIIGANTQHDAYVKFDRPNGSANGETVRDIDSESLNWVQDNTVDVYGGYPEWYKETAKKEGAGSAESNWDRAFTGTDVSKSDGKMISLVIINAAKYSSVNSEMDFARLIATVLHEMIAHLPSAGSHDRESSWGNPFNFMENKGRTGSLSEIAKEELTNFMETEEFKNLYNQYIEMQHAEKSK
jgi:hypothetical protein